MKKIIVLVVCIVSMLTATCFAASNVGSVGNGSQIPNPYITCKTMAKAEKLAGFKMKAPVKVEGYTDRTIQAVKKDMIQVSWTKGDNQLLIRKAKGKSDISGDYNVYANKLTVKVGKAKVTLKGNGTTYNVATWVVRKHAFAIDADEGLTQEAMTALVKATH